jgi:hypothetical protein
MNSFNQKKKRAAAAAAVVSVFSSRAGNCWLLLPLPLFIFFQTNTILKLKNRQSV